ncbi:MAG TPA: hypothetical protein VME46_02530 [Acidimicrobiales bacterium]|nr:hypothetical protein [Acidimicrobiales bacterium]
MIGSHTRPELRSTTTSHVEPVLPLEGPAGRALGYGPDNEPGYESIGRSALAHPVRVAVLTLLGLLLGAVIGYEYPPTYTANAQLIVGRTASLSTETIPGFDVAVQSLASDYARLVTSSNVISATEGYLHSSRLPGNLSASPIPESSIIDVQATASSKAAAVALANAGAQGLTEIVTEITNNTQSQLAPIMSTYQKADSAAEAASVQASLLQTQLNNLLANIGKNGPTPVQTAEEDVLSSEIAAELTKSDTAKLQAQTYLNEYNNAVPPYQTQEEMVQPVGAAAYSGSNRTSLLEAAGLAGLVGGLVVGLALASLADSLKARRRAKLAR